MDLSSIPQYLQVVLGIGLVIFVHEAGHFLAARLCKVRVHVFSLGFGPVLFSWKRGHTTFQVAAVPLGGYVRMAGDESLGSSGGEPQPWELGAKSVPQRFLIYSGGVLMNVAFGIVVFPILFLAGIPSFEPIVGKVEADSVAWHAGLQPGTRVVSVNGREIYDISQLPQEVAYGGSDAVELVLLPPGSQAQQTLRLAPEYSELEGLYSIGRVAPAVAAGFPLHVEPGSSAAAAGLQDGDLLLGIEGFSEQLSPERQFIAAVSQAEPITLHVRRGDEPLTFEVAAREQEVKGKPLMGVRPMANLLTGLRESPLTEATGLEPGDLIRSINGQDIFDPGSVLQALLAARGPLQWRVLRDGRQLSLDSPALTEAEAIALFDDLAIGSDMRGAAIAVLPLSAADRAGFQSGDRIEKIDGIPIDEYEDIRSAAAAAGRRGRAMKVAFARPSASGTPKQLELDVKPGPYSRYEFGLGLKPARYDYRVTNGMKAISLGVGACYDMLYDVARTLSGVLRQEVSEDNLGGIITIGVIAKQTADIGLVKFFWFLCLLSMNLAFLNVLPIPLLDGGHLFFLLVEGIKGSPVSEKILSYSQLVGLVLIVSIFVFVIYNDLSMHVFN